MAEGDVQEAGGGPTPNTAGLAGVIDQPAPLWGVFATPDTTVDPGRTRPIPSPTVRDVIPDPDIAGAMGGARDIAEERLRSTEQINQYRQNRIKQDQDLMDRQQAMVAQAAGRLPPQWDADRERAERISTPFERFGSAATVFAMLASTFTKTPALAALNSGAAAMNAIKANDEAGYESAYKAWKDNTSLAVKRFDMQQTLFDNSMKLFDKDIVAWKADVMANAAKFEDKTMLNMLKNSMYPEAIQYMQGLAKAKESMLEAQRDMEIWNTNYSLYKSEFANFEKEHGPGSFDQYPPHVRELVQKALQDQYISTDKTGVTQLVAKKAIEEMTTGPNAGKPVSADTLAQFERDLKSRSYTGAQQQINDEILRRAEDYFTDKDSPTKGNYAASYDRATQEVTTARRQPTGISGAATDVYNTVLREELAKGTPEAEAKRKALEAARARPSAAGGGVVTTQRAIESAVQDYGKRQQAENPDMSPDVLQDKMAARRAELTRESQTMSANRRDELRKVHARFEVADQIFGKINGLLRKHYGITGLAGDLTRPTEVVANWFGSNQTDRAQFKRFVNELRDLKGTLFTESTRRAYAGEESRVASIVPGLNAGDTSFNTARGLKEFMDIVRFLKKDLTARIGDQPAAAGASTGGAGDGAWWRNLP